MTDSSRLSTRAKWGALLAVLVLGIVVVLTAAEGVVRVRQWAKYGTITSFERLYTVDESIPLRVLVPGMRIGGITINANGFRGPEIATPKPPDGIRIAFLGASTTFCAEVSGDAAVWPSLVIDRLRARFPDVQFDFVNGGVPGYTVKSSLLNFQHRIDRLDPDVVVIYHAANDLSAEVNALAAAQGLAVANDRPGWLERHSLLWELAAKNLTVRAAQQRAASTRDRMMLDRARLGGGFNRDLTELVAAAENGKRLVALATFSTQLRREQAEEERKRASVLALVYMPSIGQDDLLFGYRRYNDITRNVARERGALLIDGEYDIPGDPVHFVDTVHFSDAGSRKMAERVFDGLVKAPAFERLVTLRQAR